MSNKLEILIACPAKYATGGTESLHQLCAAFNKCEGVEAKMYYRDWYNNRDDPVADEFKKYNCKYVEWNSCNSLIGFNGVVIFPEIWANNVCDEWWSDATKVIWWLSVDNYFTHYPAKEWFKFANQVDAVHITQSSYAADFLLNLDVPFSTLNCYVNDEFYDTPKSNKPRGNVILYNPAKDTGYVKLLMNIMPDVDFRPIKGMTRDEVIEAMDTAKIYIDFGTHPGRERMPREAALRGCVVITGRDGSADNYMDIPIPYSYKVQRSYGNLPYLRYRIKEILDHSDFALFQRDFEQYRKLLRKDREKFLFKVAEMAEILKGIVT